MLTKKQIVKTTGMVAASLILSLTLPTSQSHAASLLDHVGSTNSWVQSIFQQVWAKSHGGYKDGNKTEDSAIETPADNKKEDTNNNSGSTNENTNEGKSDPNTDTKPNEDQSNVTLADKIIQTGEKYLGTPYQYGAASGQTRTFDCSSFTQYVFKQHGISLPRSSRQQSTVGTTVSRSELKKGDLLFFTTSSSNGRIGHVGIYAGDNKILHTWGPGGVRYDSLSTKWLDRGYVTAKRVIK